MHRGLTKLSGRLSGKCENDPIERDSIERDSLEREIQRELILLSVKKELREAGIIEKTDNEISDEKD